MRTVFTLIIVSGLMLLQQQQSHAQTDTINTVFDNIYMSDFFSRRILSNHTVTFLDDVANFTLFELETVGQYSDPDPYVLSIAGNSYMWNKYYFKGHRIDDHYFTGSPLHRPFIQNMFIQIRTNSPELHFTTSDSSTNIAGLSFNMGNLGGPAPFSENIIHLFHRTAREALYNPLDIQRHTAWAVNAFTKFNINKNGRSYPVMFSADAGSRLIIDSDYHGISGSAFEPYKKVFLVYTFPVANPAIDRQILVSLTDRENLFSENYYALDETAKFKEINISLAEKRINTNLDGIYSTGLNLSYKDIRHNKLNFLRNFIDQDGEGLEPWYPDGGFLELSHHFIRYDDLPSGKDHSLINLNNSLINFSPGTKDFSNPVYYQSTDMNYRSLYLYDWRSDSFLSGIFENSFGIARGHAPYLLYFGPTIDGFVTGTDHKITLNYELTLSTAFRKTRAVEFSINAGRIRVPYNYYQVRFLSDNYMSGEIYYWGDQNEDKTYQANELGSIFSTTGGAYHRLDKKIKQPVIYYLEIPAKLQLTPRNMFLVTGFYRQFRHLWTVVYDGGASAYGFTDSTRNGELYYLHNGEVSYLVTNYENNENYTVHTQDKFLKQPFAAGLNFLYKYEAPRFYLSAAFTMYMVVGCGTIGNGYMHDNFGVLSESSANPNTSINAYGRMSNDRSYIGKLTISYIINKNFTAVFLFKYRDGQPVANYSTALYESGGEAQVSIWQQKVNGDIPFEEVIGNREDGFFNTVLRLQYTNHKSANPLQITASVYNIYDFGTELTEYSFAPIGTARRFVYELNIPRGVIISLVKQF